MYLWSWLLCLVLAVVVPWLSARSASVTRQAGLTRSALYVNIAFSLWLLGAAGYLALRLDGGVAHDVGVTPAGLDAMGLAGWTVLLTAGGLAVFTMGHWLGFSRHDRAQLSWLRPETNGERVLLAFLVSPSAGICEEFLYRGVILTLLRQVLPVAGALAVSSFLFAGAHVYQSWRGATRAGLIGLMLAASPLITGSILPGMAAHALIDILGVLVVWPLLERRTFP